ncbi:hypothetical protein ACWCQM_06820 [Streptomyces sp. NPDC002125]
MSVDPPCDPQVAHRLFQPVARDVIRQYLESRTPAPEIPETFRGPNYQEKESS